MIEGVDPRFGHQRKTLNLTGPCFSALNFPVGKTVTGKCRAEKYVNR
jgi:hypothetical protein